MSYRQGSALSRRKRIGRGSEKVRRGLSLHRHLFLLWQMSQLAMKLLERYKDKLYVLETSKTEAGCIPRDNSAHSPDFPSNLPTFVRLNTKFPGRGTCI